MLWAAGTLLAGSALTGCEYTYDDGWQPPEEASAAPVVTNPVPSRDWWRNDPVDLADMNIWLRESRMEPNPRAVHDGHGLLRSQEVRNDATAALPAGTYVLALSCRSQRRVNFSVRDAELTLVELSLRCESRREDLIYLSKESVLTFRVEARSPANFAYRLIPR
jgi:hypothetical protein